ADVSGYCIISIGCIHTYSTSAWIFWVGIMKDDSRSKKSICKFDGGIYQRWKINAKNNYMGRWKKV
ncbi:MAG: hypothetical protein PHQ65_16715, partial [Bacteroidales bacterium]|nr:hypothetical protein [Bacteroidales bacterium]